MNLRSWFSLRGTAFVGKRAVVLLNRYGMTPARAEDRIEACTALLSKYGSAPTFPTPGRVVQCYASFIRRLQNAGAEIAVHSYDHVDLAACPPAKASEQLQRATQVFERYGIEVHGFRCPYLSCTDELLNVLPPGLFGYSSNKAIRWDVLSRTGTTSADIVFNTINRFYQPTSALDAVCVPWMQADLVEIPVCVPDDLQLHDGLRLGSEEIGQVWGQTLDQVHRRGELFTLIFHPELASFLEGPFVSLLHRASQLHPPVWIARLCDISRWWKEKSGFRVEVGHTSTGLRLSFTCSSRATILARGLGPCGSEQGWDGAYYRLPSIPLDVPANPRPFVGLPVNAPTRVMSFLENQGYVLDTSETAPCCGIYLSAATLTKLTNGVQLINHIEESTGPLVRYGRWPDGAKSALSISGDLDALTLLDYLYRLFVR